MQRSTERIYPMHVFRRVVMFMLAGAFLGGLVGTYLARFWMPWYNSPGGEFDAMQVRNPQQLIRHTIDELLKAQLTGALVGAVVFLVIGLLVSRWLAKRAAAHGPHAAPPASPSPPAKAA